MGMIMLGTQNYKTLGGKRYHKISKHASLISQRWLFVHWFFKTNFFICFFFFFIFSFKNFITLLLCAMASALLLIIFIDYIIFVVVGGEVFVSVRNGSKMMSTMKITWKITFARWAVVVRFFFAQQHNISVLFLSSKSPYLTKYHSS